MSPNFLIVAVLTLGLSNSHNFCAEAAAVEGIVLDPHDSVIPDGTVYLTDQTNMHFKCDVGTNGTFAFDVRPGIYFLTMTGEYMLPLQRAPIEVRPDQSVYIRLRPIFRAPTDQNLIKDAQVKYEPFKMTFESRLYVEIRFTQFEQVGTSRIYSGPQTLLSYDTLSVYGTRVECDEGSDHCVVRGTVSVENGTEQHNTTVANVDFRRRKISLGNGTTLPF